MVMIQYSVAEALKQLGREMVTANPQDAVELWTCVRIVADEQLAQIEAGGQKSASLITSVDMLSKAQQLFLATAYDLFALAECAENAPWTLVEKVRVSEERLRKRWKYALSGPNDIIRKNRCTTSNTDEFTSGSCDDVETIHDISTLPVGRDRRQSVRVEDFSGFECIPVYFKTDRETNILMELLNKGGSFVFEAIKHDTETIRAFVNALKAVNVPSGSFAIRQGDYGDGMYFINDGVIELSKDNEVFKVLGSGDVFGELGVLHCGFRTYSARAIKNAKLWFLDRQSYTALVRMHIEKPSLPLTQRKKN